MERITNKNGKVITDLQSWEKAFIEVDNKVHWEKGRSAYSLAEYFTTPDIENSNGDSLIKMCLERFGLKNIVNEYAEIEHESKFDSHRNGRMQDLVIWARSDNKPIVICIEAKVDETFGSTTVSSAYKKFRAKEKSKGGERIEELMKEYYPNEKIEDCEIRYQLLYYLAGSITEAIKINGSVFMPVIVYETEKYNKKISENNRKKYMDFIKSLDFEQIPCEDNGICLFKKTLKGIDVLSAYIHIKL